MRPVRAFVSGCAGLALSADEQRFFEAAQPWGLILFKRNVELPDQVRRLDECLPRLRRPRRCSSPDRPGRRPCPAARAATLARLSRRGGVCGVWGPGLAAEAARLGGQLIGADLRALGITVDCAPVLDIVTPATHQAIGNRAFGSDPDTVARLGRAFAEGLLAAGVLPVVKHCPGHGRASVDSHVDLPVVTASRAELDAVDFKPFAALADLPVAMTAHVVFEALDPANPATTSRTIIEGVIRGAMAFDGLLLSDDLSMQALRGSSSERATAALDGRLRHCPSLQWQARGGGGCRRGCAGACRACGRARRPRSGGDCDGSAGSVSGLARPL